MLQILSNKKLSDLEEFHIWHRHLTVQVKQRYINRSVCVLFHCKLNFLLKISENYFWMSSFNVSGTLLK